MTGKFKQVKISTTAAVCGGCGKTIEQGCVALWRYNSASIGGFDVVCDEFCLVDFNQQFAAPLDTFLTRLAQQFN